MAAWWRRNTRTLRVVLLVGILAVIVGTTRVCAQEGKVGSPTVSTNASTLASRATTSVAATGTALPTTSLPLISSVTVPPSSLVPADTTTSTEGAGPGEEPVVAANARVTKVVDGDSLVAAIPAHGEEEVRLIGIDAPESGEPFYEEARRELARLVSNAPVQLESDIEERDQYGRLLAYVWVGKILVNAELLRLGVATLYTIPPNVKYVEQLKAAQDQAQSGARGMWGAPGHSPVKIVQVNYDPTGDDNLNLNAEYVVFEVLVPGTLLGYSVQDEAGHRYQFPDLVFKKGDVFKLHSGQGTDTRTDLYWGATGSAIWNNTGDTVKVLDPEGRIVESYSYQVKDTNAGVSSEWRPTSPLARPPKAFPSGLTGSRHMRPSSPSTR